MAKAERKYLTRGEVAKRFKVSRPLIYDWVRRGIFPDADLQDGRTIRWSVGVVEQWERANATHAKNLGLSLSEFATAAMRMREAEAARPTAERNRELWQSESRERAEKELKSSQVHLALGMAQILPAFLKGDDPRIPIAASLVDLLQIILGAMVADRALDKNDLTRMQPRWGDVMDFVRGVEIAKEDASSE